ncbi:DUF2933 domain-containing protein [Pseudomonadota bacterium]
MIVFLGIGGYFLFTEHLAHTPGYLGFYLITLSITYQEKLVEQFEVD